MTIVDDSVKRNYERVINQYKTTFYEHTNIFGSSSLRSNNFGYVFAYMWRKLDYDYTVYVYIYAKDKSLLQELPKRYCFETKRSLTAAYNRAIQTRMQTILLSLLLPDLFAIVVKYAMV